MDFPQKNVLNLNWPWRAFFWATPFKFCEKSYFLKMYWWWNFGVDISTGFRFTKNQCESAVHIFRCPWVTSERDNWTWVWTWNPSERNHKYSWSLHIYYLPFYWLEMLIFFCKVNSKNIIVMVSCTEEVDHCKHNMIHHLNHAPEKGKVENHYSTCGRIIYSKIFKMNDKWCNRTTKLFPIKHS